jgi:hypothetical protein
MYLLDDEILKCSRKNIQLVIIAVVSTAGCNIAFPVMNSPVPRTGVRTQCTSHFNK